MGTQIKTQAARAEVDGVGMRKISRDKAKVGDWAIWRTDHTVMDRWPHLQAEPITELEGERNVIAGRRFYRHEKDWIAVSAEDGPKARAEIEKLATKREQAMATMDRVLGDHLKRSEVGQLKIEERSR